jgi:hypothetical protein
LRTGTGTCSHVPPNCPQFQNLPLTQTSTFQSFAYIQHAKGQIPPDLASGFSLRSNRCGTLVVFFVSLQFYVARFHREEDLHCICNSRRILPLLLEFAAEGDCLVDKMIFALLIILGYQKNVCYEHHAIVESHAWAEDVSSAQLRVRLPNDGNVTLPCSTRWWSKCDSWNEACLDLAWQHWGAPNETTVCIHGYPFANGCTTSFPEKSPAQDLMCLAVGLLADCTLWVSCSHMIYK